MAMKANRVPTVDEYALPSAPVWSRIPHDVVELSPTPIGLQPTEYIRVKWDQIPYGATPNVAVAAVHDGQSMAVRMKWQCPEKHPKDAAAMTMIASGEPILATMGGEDAEIHILHWMASKPELRSVVATGIGSSRLGGALKTSVAATWENGEWTVVLVRQLGSGAEIAPLSAGAKQSVGFAVWRGANNERAGLKAFSEDWMELALAP
jgi:DMSO reductase family type II enzyme heme b subunit